jgi:preprotein translocase subunit YajC
MRISYPLFELQAKAIALSAAAIIIVVVLLAANVTITNAQQQQQQEQQQLSTSQLSNTSSVTQNGTTATTTLFESTNDSFRVQLPEGWVIQDVNNTGFALAAEVTEGYGVLAQLCPEGEEGGQQQGALTNVSSSSSSSSCQQQQQQAQEEIIHIIRYPNLGSRLGIAVDDINDIIPNSILE